MVRRTLALSSGIHPNGVRVILHTFKKRQSALETWSNLYKILQGPYIYSIYLIAYYFVGTPPQVRNIRGGGDGACALRFRDRQQMRFKTYSHIDFKFYDDLFYTVETAEGQHKRRRKIPLRGLKIFN